MFVYVTVMLPAHFHDRTEEITVCETRFGQNTSTAHEDASKILAEQTTNKEEQSKTCTATKKAKHEVTRLLPEFWADLTFLYFTIISPATS